MDQFKLEPMDFIKDDNKHIMNSRKLFSGESIPSVLIDDNVTFAYEMTFGGKGQHRNHRSGGSIIRKKSEIFIDTLQGKLAESALRYKLNQLYSRMNKDTEDPEPLFSDSLDIGVKGLGAWDCCDLLFKGKPVSIKSSKHFANLMLLEKKDYDENGNYIPNKNTACPACEYYFLVRIKPAIQDLMNDFIKQYGNNSRISTLKTYLRNYNLKFDIPGYITHEDLKQIIASDQSIKKNSCFCQKPNGKLTKMDADNYYVQSGSMRTIESLPELS